MNNELGEKQKQIVEHLNIAKKNLEEAKQKCDDIYPSWQLIGKDIKEEINKLESILEKSFSPDRKRVRISLRTKDPARA